MKAEARARAVHAAAHLSGNARWRMGVELATMKRSTGLVDPRDYF